MVAIHRAGDHTVAELVELLGVGRATVYRALERHPAAVDSAVTLPLPTPDLTAVFHERGPARPYRAGHDLAG